MIRTSRAFAGRVGRLTRALLGYGLLGCVVGAATAGLDALVQGAAHRLLGPLGFEQALPPAFGPHWARCGLPAAGGLVAGLLSAWLAPEALGIGLDRVVRDWRGGEPVRSRVALVKLLATVATLGSGGSGGVEAPAGHIGGSLGASAARVFRLGPVERRVWVVAGCAAGLAASFHAPLAAAVFMAELPYRDLHLDEDALLPAVLAATPAQAVYGALRPYSPILPRPDVSLPFGWPLLGLLVLAVVLAAAASGFTALYRATKARFDRSPLPLWARPALGGLLAGAIGLLAPQVLGPGYTVARVALLGQAGLAALLGLALAKAAATVATTASGGAAGLLFAPSLAIGGALGAIVASLLGGAMPALAPDPGAYVLVGMAGFLAVVANTPLAAVIVTAELGGTGRLLIPGAWVALVAWSLGRNPPLFPEQIRGRSD